jgi:hypothetical protein
MAKRKLFTVAKANRTLPLAARIAKDIQEKYLRLQQIRREQAKPPQEERALQESEPFQLEGQIYSHVNELNAIGCELKDYEKGLLDFYADKEGEIIYLCWMLGEDEIRFWHTLEGGFNGRRPISLLPKETLG